MAKKRLLANNIILPDSEVGGEGSRSRALARTELDLIQEKLVMSSVGRAAFTKPPLFHTFGYGLLLLMQSRLVRWE